MKEKYSAVLLALFGGGIGLHKFYLRKITSGVLYAVFCWTLIPWLLSLIDKLYYLFMDKEKFDAKYNTPSQKKKKVKNKSSENKSKEKSVYDQLRDLKDLFDSGAISNDEYDVIKQTLMKDLEV